MAASVIVIGALLAVLAIAVIGVVFAFSGDGGSGAVIALVVGGGLVTLLLVFGGVGFFMLKPSSSSVTVMPSPGPVSFSSGGAIGSVSTDGPQLEVSYADLTSAEADQLEEAFNQIVDASFADFGAALPRSSSRTTQGGSESGTQSITAVSSSAAQSPDASTRVNDAANQLRQKIASLGIGDRVTVNVVSSESTSEIELETYQQQPLAE